MKLKILKNKFKEIKLNFRENYDLGDEVFEFLASEVTSSIRELIGASKLEDSEHEKILMVITSSKFTFGAREAAAKENIELIDGDVLLNDKKE